MRCQANNIQALTCSNLSISVVTTKLIHGKRCVARQISSRFAPDFDLCMAWHPLQVWKSGRSRWRRARARAGSFAGRATNFPPSCAGPEVRALVLIPTFVVTPTFVLAVGRWGFSYSWSSQEAPTFSWVAGVERSQHKTSHPTEDRLACQRRRKSRAGFLFFQSTSS